MELVINTFGVTLSRENEAFLITHNGGKQRIPADGVHSIHICRGALITSDAILLAIEREIDVLFFSRQGSPMGRIWSHQYGSISTIRKNQVDFSFSPASLVWIKRVLRDKIEGQQALLLSMVKRDVADERKVQTAVRRLEDYRSKIESIEGPLIVDVAPKLRGWEGIASKIYFECIGWFLPTILNFKERSQHPAMDVTNTFLNYGYGILYGKVESALIKSGIDPYVGVFHRDDYNRPVLAFDVIEKYRVWIDYVVFRLLSQEVVTDEFYSIRSDGSYWLEALGRRVLIQSITEYFEEVITLKGLSRSRDRHIELYAQGFAQELKNYKPGHLRTTAKELINENLSD